MIAQNVGANISNTINDCIEIDQTFSFYDGYAYFSSRYYDSNIAHVFRSDKRGAGVAIIWKERLQSVVQLCKIKVKSYTSFQYQCMIFNVKPNN